MVKGLEKFSKLPGKERRVFLEALATQLWVGLMLKVIPFRWIPRVFSSRQSAVGSQQSNAGGQLPEGIEMYRDAIQRAGRVSPWKNRCLVSSLAGRCMLRRRKIPSQLSLGVKSGAGERITAHAWLASGGIEIVEKSGDYTEMYRF